MKHMNLATAFAPRPCSRDASMDCSKRNREISIQNVMIESINYFLQDLNLSMQGLSNE